VRFGRGAGTGSEDDVDPNSSPSSNVVAGSTPPVPYRKTAVRPSTPLANAWTGGLTMQQNAK